MLSTFPKSHCGGRSLPRRAQAASFAAPIATYSPGGGSKTSRPKIADAIFPTAGFFAAPPTNKIRLT